MNKFYTLLLLVSFFSVDLTSQTLVDSENLGSLTKEQISQSIPLFVNYGVDLYKLRYKTLDINNEIDTASGLVIIPQSEDPFLWPILSYSHGTVGEKQDVPSNLRGGYELALAFGAAGYISVAADFLGLGESRGFHPYLHAATEASASIDMLLATKEFTAQNNILLNDQLFVTGYSQGGHVAMATHQVLQEQYGDEFTVTASAPMSGPYSLSGAFKELIVASVPYEYPIYLAYTILSFNLVYDWGFTVEEIFKMPYSETIADIFNEEQDLFALNDALIDQLTAEEGSTDANLIFEDSLVAAVINDPNHPVNVALRANDTFNWSPDAPTRLYYCTADEQVSFRNSIIADSILNSNGAVDLSSLDVNTEANHGGCVLPAAVNTVLFFANYVDIQTSLWGGPEVNRLELAPNPTSDQVVLRNVEETGLLEIYDIQGKLWSNRIINQTNTDLVVDLSSLPQGTYYFRLIGNQQVWLATVHKVKE